MKKRVLSILLSATDKKNYKCQGITLRYNDVYLMHILLYYHKHSNTITYWTITVKYASNIHRNIIMLVLDNFNFSCLWPRAKYLVLPLLCHIWRLILQIWEFIAALKSENYLTPDKASNNYALHGIGFSQNWLNVAISGTILTPRQAP